MQFDFVPHLESGVPSKVMKDLLNEVDALKSFGSAGLRIDQFRKVSAAKKASYSDSMRRLVASELRTQNQNLSERETELIQRFESGATTVTTGHQLMVCGGTAFFEVKILSTIALARTLSKDLGEPVVPIFWMATEDHDFEEIASFQVNGRRFTWQEENTGGPVGRISTDNLAAQLEAFLSQTRLTKAQDAFLSARLQAYKNERNLAEATRAIVRHWAADLGVLVIDGDSAVLKEACSDLWHSELNAELSELIQQQSASLTEKGYSAQVYPRPINLFEIHDGSRDRIEEKSRQLNPYEISPNALLRPVYQEHLLPNLAYVGGGGELAYWLQLGLVFEELNIPMPLLYLRDSLLCLTEKTSRKLEQQEMAVDHLLSTTKEAELKNSVDYYGKLTNETGRLSAPLQEAVTDWGKSMLELYPEMEKHVEALEVKMSKLANKSIEHRYRLSKQRNEVSTSRIHEVFDQVYPQGVFWERKSSFADVLGVLGGNPSVDLVEKMSTIKAGTHVLRPSK